MGDVTKSLGSLHTSRTRSKRASSWLCWALAPWLLLVATSAHADDKEDAEKHFKAGVALQKVEDFDAAIAAFESSLRLYPSKGALFNLANCLRATHRYGEALDVLQRLDRDFGADLDPSMRTAVDEQLEELRNATASLGLRIDRTGAEVRVDGELVGTTPLPAELVLSPGEHQLEVRLDGFDPVQRTVELVPGDSTTLTITLTESAPPPPPPPPPPVAPTASTSIAPAPPPADDGSGALTTAGWIVGVTGVAALASGAATGIWALSLDGDLAARCPEGNCPADSAADIDRLGTLTTVTNVLLGVGVTFTTAGLLMVLLDEPADGPEQDAPTLGLSLGPGGVGAALGWSF